MKQFSEKHPPSETPLADWFEIAKDAEWRNPTEVRLTFPHADTAKVASKRTVTIFDIGGNKYRLITAIHYNMGLLYILRILTHAQYDKEQWKEQL